MAAWENDDWGVGSATGIPLSNDDMDFGFVAPTVFAIKNNNIAGRPEFPVDTPAATPDADKNSEDATSASAAKTFANDDFGGSPAAGRDSGPSDDGFGGKAADRSGGSTTAGFGDDDTFGDGTAGSDASGPIGTLLAGEDVYNVRAGCPMGHSPMPKVKRVIRPDLVPDKAKDKGFHEYFIAELSELYDDGDPKDTREVPLRRQEDYYVLAKELAASAKAGAARPQTDAEKKSKKKSHIHYNGDRKTTSYTWEDFEIRLLLCMIIRGVHTSGTSGATDRWNKRRITESRRSLNDSLPKVTDGHVHRGQWAYHDVAKLLNFHTNDEIPVVDVRDMIHRLIDQHKGALNLANRIHAPRMTKTVAMAWRRQQDFVGDLKEWYGDKGEGGRKDRLERFMGQKNELPYEVAQNALQQVEGHPGIDGGSLSQTYTQKDAHRKLAGHKGPLRNEFERFGDALTPAQTVGRFSKRAFGSNFAAPPAAQPVKNSFDNDASAGTSSNVAVVDTGGDEWGSNDAPLTNTPSNVFQAMDASSAAPRHFVSRLGAFGIEHPFAVPLPGKTGFKDIGSAASSDAGSGAGSRDASAPAQAVAVFSWGSNDDFAAPLAGQSAQNSRDVYAPISTSNDVSMADAVDNDEGGRNSNRSALKSTKIPGGNFDAFLDDMMTNTAITSSPIVHQFGGFTQSTRQAKASRPPTFHQPLSQQVKHKA